MGLGSGSEFRSAPDGTRDLALAQAKTEVTPGPGEPAPRFQGTRGRPKEERGLPESGQLLEMAEVYLRAQRRLWPELAGTAILPEPSPGVLEEMAAGFRRRFLDQQLESFEAGEDLACWESLGTGYGRYSSDSSNPRSCEDQLALQLQRAAQDRVFIPWAYVFADAGVTGTTAARKGYQTCKRLVRQTGPGKISTLYIDEIGRAARDAIEALKLGAIVKKAGRRMLEV